MYQDHCKSSGIGLGTVSKAGHLSYDVLSAQACHLNWEAAAAPGEKQVGMESRAAILCIHYLTRAYGSSFCSRQTLFFSQYLFLALRCHILFSYDLIIRSLDIYTHMAALHEGISKRCTRVLLS